MKNSRNGKNFKFGKDLHLAFTPPVMGSSQFAHISRLISCFLVFALVLLVTPMFYFGAKAEEIPVSADNDIIFSVGDVPKSEGGATFAETDGQYWCFELLEKKSTLGEITASSSTDGFVLIGNT